MMRNPDKTIADDSLMDSRSDSRSDNRPDSPVQPSFGAIVPLEEEADAQSPLETAVQSAAESPAQTPKKGRFPNIDPDAVSFHMPGHKGRLIFQEESPFDPFGSSGASSEPCSSPAFLKYDVTELPGFDNLISPDGWIKDLTDRISDFYGSRASRISVGGSTAAILSAILGAAEFVKKSSGLKSSGLKSSGSTAKKAVRARINRNSHISVYNALNLGEIEAEYLHPRSVRGIPSHIDLEELLNGIRESDLLILTYPFYSGAIYDMETLIRKVREQHPEIIVIVDEAHGAHFVLEERLRGKKISALSLGADLVIQSLHKTLPALGQSAVLHYGNTEAGRRLYSERNAVRSVEWYLKALQTSSPSYLILKSMSQMMDILETKGTSLYRNLSDQIDAFYRHIGHIPFDYKGFAVQDTSKILLPFADRDLLLQNGIYPEMQIGQHTLFLASIANRAEDFARLENVIRASRKDSEAVKTPDAFLKTETHSLGNETDSSTDGASNLGASNGESARTKDDISGSAASAVSHNTSDDGSHNESDPDASDGGSHNTSDGRLGGVLLSYGGSSGEYHEIFAKDAAGNVSAETLILYPPGSPVIVRGERFSPALCETLGLRKVKVEVQRNDGLRAD